MLYLDPRPLLMSVWVWVFAGVICLVVSHKPDHQIPTDQPLLVQLIKETLHLDADLHIKCIHSVPPAALQIPYDIMMQWTSTFRTSSPVSSLPAVTQKNRRCSTECPKINYVLGCWEQTKTPHVATPEGTKKQDVTIATSEGTGEVCVSTLSHKGWERSYHHSHAWCGS